MKQFGKTVTEYKTELRELTEFVPELANSEEYLCSKFEERPTLEIWEKMLDSDSQSYKEVVQLALRAEKLTVKECPKKNSKEKGFRIYVWTIFYKESKF